MKQITKEEAMAVRGRYGDEVGIAITNRHKRGGRKRYYVEESERVMSFLNRFREKRTRAPRFKKEPC